MRHLTALILVITFGASLAGASEWRDHEQNLMALGTRIHSLRNTLSELLHQSALTSDQTVKRTLLSEIVKLEADLHKETAKMSAELEHIRYEHPDRGQDFEPMAAEFNLELPDQMSSSPRLDELLTESKELLERVYGVSFSSPHRALASQAAQESQPPPAPRWLLEK